MFALILLGLVSFAISMVSTPVCRILFRHFGVFDHPDGQRKLHGHPIPRAGGIPIMAAYLGAFAVLLISPLSAGRIVKAGLPLAWRILPAAALVLITGFVDDIRGLKPWHKLVGQATAGYIVFWAGVGITNLGVHSIPQWLSLPLTVFWLLACSNAFNLIDGVDGLSAGVGFFSAVTMLVAALLQGNVALATATAPLAGAMLAFLRYNFNPASIYLGDSGSLTIGFLLGCYGAIWSQKSATLLGMTAPLIALALPLLDVAISVLRRFLRGQPILGADRGHIHHMLLKRGLTPRRAVLLLYGVAGVFAALSLVQSIFHNRNAGTILVLFCVVAWIGVHNLGYLEFRSARRVVFGRTFHNLMKGQLALNEFQASLDAAKSVDECWQTMRKAARDFGFNKVEMSACGRRYVSDAGMAHASDYWQARIALSEGEWMNFSTANGSASTVPLISQFLDSARNGMKAKLAEMRSSVKMKPSRVAIQQSIESQAGD